MGVMMVIMRGIMMNGYHDRCCDNGYLDIRCDDGYLEKSCRAVDSNHIECHQKADKVPFDA